MRKAHGGLKILVGEADVRSRSSLGGQSPQWEGMEVRLSWS